MCIGLLYTTLSQHIGGMFSLLSEAANSNRETQKLPLESSILIEEAWNRQKNKIFKS